MSIFEPLANLIALLSVLSVAAERVTNILKLRSDELRTRTLDEDNEQERTRAIQWRTFVVGALFALLLKADMFTILANLDDPWSTIGWVRVSGSQWFQTPATANAGTILYAVLGTIITGIALGFGSKFWHDILDTVHEIRAITRTKGTAVLFGESHGDGDNG